MDTFNRLVNKLVWIHIFPELKLLSSETQQIQVLNEVFSSKLLRRFFWFWSTVLGSILGVLSVEVACFFSGSDVFETVILVSGSIFLFLIVIAIGKNRISYLIRVRLTNMGIKICLRCGYNIKGQLEPRCPECGVAFDEKLLQRDEQPHENKSANAL